MDIIKFAFKFSNLKPTEREIIEYLYNCPVNDYTDEHTFIGGYSDFVRALNKSVYENVSNYRKTFINLQNKHIVSIIKEKKNHKIILNYKWKEEVYNG